MALTDQELHDLYVTRALALVRVSNSFDEGLQALLNELRRQINRGIRLSYEPDMGVRAREALLKSIRERVASAYAALALDQKEFVKEVLEAEAAYTVRVGAYERAASQSALARAVQRLLVMGASVEDQWDRLAETLSFGIGRIVATSSAAEVPLHEVLVYFEGTGNVFEQAFKQSRGLVEASVMASGNQGRLATFGANNTKYVMWHAILDARVCPTCGVRANRVWDTSGQPVGHSLPMIPPPVHPWCRCVLVPVSSIPSGKGDTFNAFLNRLSEETQNEVLGTGRADLWRRGVITLTDLIGQNGFVLNLSDLPSG